MPQHLKCLTTVIYDLPISNCHMFSDIKYFISINISPGSVVTRLSCGGIFSYHFTANLSLSPTMKSFEHQLRFDKVTAMSLVVQFFLKHSVVSWNLTIIDNSFTSNERRLSFDYISPIG